MNDIKDRTLPTLTLIVEYAHALADLREITDAHPASRLGRLIDNSQDLDLAQSLADAECKRRVAGRFPNCLDSLGAPISTGDRVVIVAESGERVLGKVTEIALRRMYVQVDKSVLNFDVTPSRYPESTTSDTYGNLEAVVRVDPRESDTPTTGRDGDWKRSADIAVEVGLSEPLIRDCMIWLKIDTSKPLSPDAVDLVRREVRRRGYLPRLAPGPSVNAPEPAPIANTSTPIWDLVIDDIGRDRKDVGGLVEIMRERDAAGRSKYGVPLQANNGRDPMIDAMQESLDLCAYLRQALAEAGDVDADIINESYTTALGLTASLYRKIVRAQETP